MIILSGLLQTSILAWRSEQETLESTLYFIYYSNRNGELSSLMKRPILVPPPLPIESKAPIQSTSPKKYMKNKHTHRKKKKKRLKKSYIVNYKCFHYRQNKIRRGIDFYTPPISKYGVHFLGGNYTCILQNYLFIFLVRKNK